VEAKKQEPMSPRNQILKEPGNVDKNTSRKTLAKEAKRQRKQLAKHQKATVLSGPSEFHGPLASPLENKKRRKQRHRLFFRLRQSNISLIYFIW
jgi:mRNA-degrading endonuclease RelE of RelBE toxin-antitoxin system